ncbi:MAG: transcriptional repressor LexA [Acidobacteriota bacterium]|nr:transcriptional repressor LexA [Acidobacteriota bacterium]
MGRTPAGQTRERIYRFLQERLLTGQPPTIREVQQAFKFRSVQTAREHLEGLVADGRLTKQAGKSRGYRLPADREPSPLQWVPLLGRVQAGALTEAIEDPDGFVPLSSSYTKTYTTPLSGEDYFALRVEGESMIDAGILPDDIAIVRRQSTARSGEIVVAMVGEEATVKRLRLRGRRVELHPENPRFKPIVPGPEPVVVLGKVMEIRREY